MKTKYQIQLRNDKKKSVMLSKNTVEKNTATKSFK